MTCLLDVSVLVALNYVEHDLHVRAHSWLGNLLEREASVNLAMCSITDLGFVRVACGPAAFATDVSVAQDDLKRMKTQRQFIFLDDTLGADRLPLWVKRPKHVTDGHLLALAKLNHAIFVTLDKGIPGALLIEECPQIPPMVREPAVHYGAAV